MPIRATWWLLLAALPPALLWMALAWKHMLASDPARERKKARLALLRDFRAIDSANAKPTTKDLHKWRASTRAMWGITQAAPPAVDVANAVANSGNNDAADEWSTLWREAEAFLFGSDSELKADWLARATNAARKAHIKSSQPPLPLKLRHWSPRAAVLVAVAFLSFSNNGEAAESPENLYRDGRFSEAREIWTGELAGNPKDWAAHNNIALTFAQENEWSRAVAHWTAAFLLNPADESLRSNLQLGLARNQGVDPLVRKMLAGNLADRTAARLAPGTWQVMYFCGGAIVAIGLITAIVALYSSRRTRVIRTTGLGLAVVGVIISTVALTAVDRYGLLAEPTAALTSIATQLRSIPTDLAEDQQTTPIAAGTVVVVIGERSFLGWEQVLTGSGSVGWIRAEATTPFYQAARVAPTSTGATQSPLKNLASIRK
jgi:tetratricopeptide (TPR) repeat protein